MESVEARGKSGELFVRQLPQKGVFVALRYIGRAAFSNPGGVGHDLDICLWLELPRTGNILPDKSPPHLEPAPYGVLAADTRG